jgi:hypothetical protein
MLVMTPPSRARMGQTSLPSETPKNEETAVEAAPENVVASFLKPGAQHPFRRIGFYDYKVPPPPRTTMKLLLLYVGTLHRVASKDGSGLSAIVKRIRPGLK